MCWSGPDYHIKQEQDRSKCSFSHPTAGKWFIKRIPSCIFPLSVSTHLCPCCPSCYFQVTELLVPKSTVSYLYGYLSLISLLWWSTPATDPLTSHLLPISGMLSDPFWHMIVHSVHLFRVNNTRTPQTVFKNTHLWGRHVLIKSKEIE